MHVQVVIRKRLGKGYKKNTFYFQPLLRSSGSPVLKKKTLSVRERVLKNIEI